jgi:hypothetical protein
MKDWWFYINKIAIGTKDYRQAQSSVHFNKLQMADEFHLYTACGCQTSEDVIMLLFLL